MKRGWNVFFMVLYGLNMAIYNILFVVDCAIGNLASVIIDTFFYIISIIGFYVMYKECEK